MANNLYTQYKESVVPALNKEFNFANPMEVPQLEKVVITIGTGKALKDTKLLDTMTQTLRRITGQEPVKTKAKESISNFSIREGMTVGLKVTLRDERMYDFVEKLVNVTFPRMKDFQGIEAKGFDGNGNFSIGFKEHIVFPEISSNEVEQLHGLGITFSIKAKNDTEAKRLLDELGFPFKKENK